MTRLLSACALFIAALSVSLPTATAADLGPRKGPETSATVDLYKDPG